MRAWIARVAQTAALALAAAGPAAGGEIIDRLLAIVNGALITQTDVYGALAFGLVDGSGPAEIGRAHV